MPPGLRPDQGWILMAGVAVIAIVVMWWTLGRLMRVELDEDELIISNYRTEIDGLYLCGPSAFPGGGVHAACGYNAYKKIAEDFGLPSPIGSGRKLNPSLNSIEYTHESTAQQSACPGCCATVRSSKPRTSARNG